MIRGLVDTLEPEVIAVVAGITKVPASRITPDTDLRVDLNVDSLQGLQIVAALEKRFNIELSDEDLDAYTSVRSICEAVGRAKGA
jgi:acyl carrier protein